MALFSRPLETEINCSEFGAVGDGITDDTAAIQRALDRAGDLISSNQSRGISGKAIVRLNGGTFLISSPLIVRTATSLIGETLAPPYPNKLSGFRSNQNLYTGSEIRCSADFVGEYAVILEPDNCTLENVILDGHDIPCGSTFTKIDITTAQGKKITSEFLNFQVNDEDDYRINTFRFVTVEIPYFRIGEYREYQLQVVGGVAPYNFSLSSGQLPSGLTLSSSGLISGTVTELTTNFITIRATDSGSEVKEASFATGTIKDEIETRILNDPTQGVAYSAFLRSTYNVAGVKWQAYNLPSWMSLNETTGELTIAENANTESDITEYEITVILLDEFDNELDKRVIKNELRFVTGAIKLFGENNLRPQLGVPFSYQYEANGGYGQYTWSINEVRSAAETNNAGGVTSISPIDGLTLDPNTGLISGTPTVLGQNTYYIRITSVVDPTIFVEIQRKLRVVPAGSIPNYISRSFATAQKGTPYSFTFNVEQIPEALPYTYEAINLPTGLTIDNNGLISGTPTGATFTNGVRIQWSDNIYNCTIRGFRSGGGIRSTAEPSNLHRISGCLISVCDIGFRFSAQIYDSHFTNLYIYNCRTGMDWGAGSAGNTFTTIRIEFIHEYGIDMKTSHENDLSSFYFDTCGWSAIRAMRCKNLMVSNSRFIRSGRNIRGIGTRLNPKCANEYSNHVWLDSCPRASFTNNTFDLGTKTSGDAVLLTDHFSENVRPTYGFRIRNCDELTITGNNLTGCVNRALDANLNRFGKNTFKGANIANNVQTDILFQPLKTERANDRVYIPNSTFQIWQRDVAFAIPPATDTNIGSFAIADYWNLRRAGNGVIDQTINVSRGIGSPTGYYLHIDKPANGAGTSSGNNFQTLEIENFWSKDLKITSNRPAILSFYAKSNSQTKVSVRISQYLASPENNFAVYITEVNRIQLNAGWERYEYVMSLKDLQNIEPAENARLNFIFRFDTYDEPVDADISGIQLDFCDQTPFAQEYRKPDFEQELAFAKRQYQKSKAYDQYFASWSGGQRYDVNGAIWQPSYVTAYAPSADGGKMVSTVLFDEPVAEHPGYASLSNGVLERITAFNPPRILNRTAADKFNWNGTNTPRIFIENASKLGFTVSARGSEVVPFETYDFHWLYSNYEQDYLSSGGYFNNVAVADNYSVTATDKIRWRRVNVNSSGSELNVKKGDRFFLNLAGGSVASTYNDPVVGDIDIKLSMPLPTSGNGEITLIRTDSSVSQTSALELTGTGNISSLDGSITGSLPIIIYEAEREYELIQFGTDWIFTKKAI